MSFEQVKARHRLAWGLDVDSYVRHTSSELGPVAERLVEVADPAWNGSVIDVGCGPGTATFPAAKRVGPGGRVLGVDLAAPMVAWAERSAATQGLTHVTFMVGDAEDLGDVPDGSFERAISNFGAIFAPRPERMVEEVARVLAPGGTFTMSVWIPVGMVLEAIELLASIAPPPPEGVPTSESWGQPGVAEERLSAAFDDVSVMPLEVPCSYSSVDEAWTRTREGRPPFALAFGRLPLDQKQEVEARARAMYRQHADENGRVSFVRQAAIVQGVKR
jgi:SAM-dependent methyltransferase